MNDWEKINLALCSVNLAEASYSVISRQQLAETYLTASITVRQCMSPKLKPIAVSYLSKSLMWIVSSQSLLSIYMYMFLCVVIGLHAG